MTKQEFLAMNLPYGINILWRDGERVLLDTRNIRFIFQNDEFIKPICRPLSDLTKEIEHKGEKFVPLRKLGMEIIGGVDIIKPTNFDLQISYQVSYSDTEIDLYDGFLVVQKLIEWHFDIAALISKGEAIDVNTLETNPYK